MQLGGCGLFGVGVWLSFKQADISALPLSFPSLSAANLLLVAGGITMVTGFLGCLGALKEQRCLLMTVRHLLAQLHVGMLEHNKDGNNIKIGDVLGIFLGHFTVFSPLQ